MPQAIVAVKPASSASGASGVARYIAESKRDAQKEGLREGEARPLFSGEHDSLDYHQANQLLGEAGGDKAQADEVIHLVISLEPEKFEATADDLQARKDAFKEVVRETVQVIEDETNAEKLNWISGIHLNTDNPHAHVAISRDVLDADTGEVKRLDHLPRTLLPHHEQDTSGQMVLKPGLIADAVTLHLNHAIELHTAQTRVESPEHEPERTPEQPTPKQGNSRSRTTATPQQTQAEPNTRDATQRQSLASPPPDIRDSEPREVRPLQSSKEQQDREVLGRAMVVAAEVERLDRELNSLIEHGDKRRFRVFDASHDKTRQISQFDVHRRAEVRAGAAVRALEITDPNERHNVRTQHYKTEVAAHEKALHDHNIIVKKTLDKTNKQLGKAQVEHASLQAQVRAIVREYGQHRTLPTPFLTRDELSKLQNQTINNGNANRVTTLERIREKLAVEHDSPTRTDKEIARLEGQLLVTRAEQAARVARLRQFEQTKHQTSWQVGKEKYSLVYVDRQIAEKETASHVFGGPLMINIFPSSRRAAAAAAAQLKEVREVILTKIEDRKAELSNSLKEALKMTETLTSIFTLERDKQQSRGGERQEKELTRNEISRLVEHSFALGDPAMLRQSLLLESQYNSRQNQSASIVEQSSKAAGRELLGNIALKEATERLDAFQERKDFVPVVVQDLEGKDVTARVFDFREPLHPLKWIVQRLSESKNDRHLRNETNQAVNFQEEQLQQDVHNLDGCRQLLAADADRLRDAVLTFGHAIPDATFTTKQIMQLEIYAHRQQDPNERDRVLALINQAETSHHVFTPQKFDHEKIVTEVLAQNDPTLQDTNVLSVDQRGASPTTSPSTAHTTPDPLRNDGVSQPSSEEHDIDLFH